MANRGSTRIPCAIEVQFRSASAFLVSYATNLSSGGVFLATDEPLEIGTELDLTFSIRGGTPVTVAARVAWSREIADANGPAGMGLAFADMVARVGNHIDALVGEFRGIKVALLARDGRSSAEVGRSLKAAIASADLIELSEASFISTFGDRCDLLVVDADSEPDDGREALALAQAVEPALPTILLSARPDIRAYAESVGAIALGRPPSSAELGRAAVQILAAPLDIQSS